MSKYDRMENNRCINIVVVLIILTELLVFEYRSKKEIEIKKLQHSKETSLKNWKFT